MINTQKNSQGYVPVVVPAFNEELALSHPDAGSSDCCFEELVFELGGEKLFTPSGELLATNIATLPTMESSTVGLLRPGSIDWGKGR